LTNKTQEASIDLTMTEKRHLPTQAAAQVFRAVLTGGPLRRTDLTRQTGLSQPTIAKITRTLIDAGYLVELGRAVEPDRAATGRPGRARPSVGRPAASLDVRADREFFVGVKVTGDELIGVLTDLRANIRATRHEPLSDHDPAEVVAAIRKLVNRLRGASAATRARTYDLGVSVAGDVDRERGIARYEPFHGWRDVPLAALLAKATGLSTVVDNDIRALTEAENWFGAGARAESFLLVAIGTGVTCGLVVDGKVRAGAYGVAGELGHVGVDRQGPKCYCGARGCLEAVASDPAIARRVAEITGDPTIDVRAAVDLAHAGDADVRQVFADAGRAIGLAVGGLVNLFGPELIVISANSENGFDLLEGQLRAGIAEQAYGAAARAEIFVRPLPFEEWARGAATVAIARRVTAVTSKGASP
jgi:predicted NBD/HSP70 family sugar kinase